MLESEWIYKQNMNFCLSQVDIYRKSTCDTFVKKQSNPTKWKKMGPVNKKKYEFALYLQKY